MTVFILIRRFDFGGAENYARELANALSAKGDKVVVLSTYGRQAPLLSSSVLFKYINCSRWRLPFNLIYLFILVAKYRPSIIHAHQRSAILTACVLSRITRVPVVVTIHSTTPLELSAFTRSMPARIIYISRFTMERSDWYDSIKARCRYIPNGIANSVLPSECRDMRLVYCSRIDKSHANLLEILIKHVLPTLQIKFPMMSLKVVGDGSHLPLLKSWAKQANADLRNGSVILDGFCEQFVADGSVVLGVGRVALEALAAAVPVIAVNSRRCGSLISTNNYDRLKQTNFVDVSASKPTADMLVDVIRETVRNYPAVVEESRILQKRVCSDFAIENMIKRVRQEYHAVLDERQTVPLPRRLFSFTAATPPDTMIPGEHTANADENTNVNMARPL